MARDCHRTHGVHQTGGESMSITRPATAAIALCGGLLLAAPVSAQFDPLYSHLQCYQIRGKTIRKSVITDDQFGRSLVVKLSPTLLCLPTQKSCCQPSTTGAVCVPTTCPTGPIQPTPVPHFKCYKVAARTCVDPACTTLSGFKNDSFVVNLEDQFGLESNIRVGRPQLLCAPVEKTVVNPTTTTTTSSSSTTTTTLQPCKAPDSAGLCGGSCPPQTICLATGPASCDCVPIEKRCIGDPAAGACGGLCPSVTQTCGQPSPTAPCGCFNACGASAPVCNGACPPGHECLHLTTGGCRCS
jgi:hypothetical protein